MTHVSRNCAKINNRAKDRTSRVNNYGRIPRLSIEGSTQGRVS